MGLKKSKENHVWLIQIFQQGMYNSPTLIYRLNQYESSEGMITIMDPKINLRKSFPTSIITIDEIEAKE